MKIETKIAIKKAMKSSRILKALIHLVPLRKTILFESLPDLSDNTKAVFDEMVKRGLNEKYKMKWIVEKKDDSYPKPHNVSYVLASSKMKYFYRITCKYLICCNQWLGGCVLFISWHPSKECSRLLLYAGGD